jgi:hypothetical protein
MGQAPILSSTENPDGSWTVVYGRRDFTQGSLVITKAMLGDATLQSVVDSLYDHEAFMSTVVSRKQERNRGNG